MWLACRRIMSWYLADEPKGQGITNTSLLPKYNAIRAADASGKPVSMVFCTKDAADYLEMLDVIMVDPCKSVALRMSRGGRREQAVGWVVSCLPDERGGYRCML